MSYDDLSAEDLREYERRNAWIYEARERFYEETKDMSFTEMSDLVHKRTADSLAENGYELRDGRIVKVGVDAPSRDAALV